MSGCARVGRPHAGGIISPARPWLESCAEALCRAPMLTPGGISCPSKRCCPLVSSGAVHRQRARGRPCCCRPTHQASPCAMHTVPLPHPPGACLRPLSLRTTTHNSAAHSPIVILSEIAFRSAPSTDDHGNTATENLAVPGLATLGASPSASERAASMNAIHAHAESELARLTQRLTSVMAELNEVRKGGGWVGMCRMRSPGITMSMVSHGQIVLRPVSRPSDAHHFKSTPGSP